MAVVPLVSMSIKNRGVLPGEFDLHEDVYCRRFALTEKSFHQSGLGGGLAGAAGYDQPPFAIDHSTVPLCRGDCHCDGNVDGNDLAACF